MALVDAGPAADRAAAGGTPAAAAPAHASRHPSQPPRPDLVAGLSRVGGHALPGGLGSMGGWRLDGDCMAANTVPPAPGPPLLLVKLGTAIQSTLILPLASAGGWALARARAATSAARAELPPARPALDAADSAPQEAASCPGGSGGVRGRIRPSPRGAEDGGRRRRRAADESDSDSGDETEEESCGSSSSGSDSDCPSVESRGSESEAEGAAGGVWAVVGSGREGAGAQPSAAAGPNPRCRAPPGGGAV